MRRRIAIVGLVGAGLLAPLLTMAPASAGAGVGCNGTDCSVLLSSFIKLNGDYGTAGAAAVPLNVPPPPCLWEPIGDGTTGSQAIVKEWGPNPPTDFQINLSYAQAKGFLQNPPPPAGTWYQLPVNPAAGPAGEAACLKLPLYAFVPPGQEPPAVPIPARTLAAYAYNHMVVPTPKLTINPAAKGYVNLATYVWGSWPASAATGRMNAYKVTATLGAQVVTVWAQPSAGKALTIDTPPQGTAYSAGCVAGATQFGSQFPIGTVPAANSGAGTPPDCGVLWQAPTTAASVSATVTWRVSWGAGNLNGPGPNRLPPITVTGQSNPFPVAEIQSVNNG